MTGGEVRAAMRLIENTGIGWGQRIQLTPGYWVVQVEGTDGIYRQYVDLWELAGMVQ